RYALRTLLRSRAFTAVALLALALGIGANTAIFTVVNAVLLRPLPYREPGRLVAIKTINLKSGDGSFGNASPADFADWREQSKSFEQLAAETGGSVTLTGAGQPETFPAARVSDDYFAMFGVKPMLGRAFLPDEFKSAAGPAIILSHRLWQRRFGGDPGLVGQTLTLDGKPSTVIGVMPPDFRQPAYAEAWTPLLTDSGEMRLRGARYFTIMARLKPGVARAQAQSEMSAVAAALEEQHPQSNANWGVRVFSLQESIVGNFREALLVLSGAVGFVLLIACANVASLLLARAGERQKELAIRSALGATRLRMIRQLLTESLLLAFAGGAAGLLLALWGVKAIIRLIPDAMRFPRLDEIQIDGHALAFTLVVSLATGIVFGLMPGLRASRPDLQESLKEGGRAATGNPWAHRARGLLVISEVAIALLLLIGAGLLIRSFARLQQTELGFNSENLLAIGVSASPQKYPRPRERAAYYKQFLDRLEGLPGVESAALSSSLPLGFNLVFPYVVEGRDASRADASQAAYSSVSPNYFKAMRIPLVAGREFTERDNSDAPNVAIINETMAHKSFANEDPLGKHIKIDYLNQPTSFEVVGVVGDTKQSSLADQTNVGIYVPYFQYPWFSSLLVVRTAADVAAFAAPAQAAVWEVDKAKPISYVKTMDQLLSESVAQPRLYLTLLGAFAAVALALAVVGIYGVMSYSVGQRTREIGIRMALGAKASDVLRLVVGEGLILISAGVALGLVAALALTRVMASLLYGINATDPVTFFGVALILAGVALGACFVPARRATRVDPMVALRHE
ncbi:MAG: ABC transporter permease, partial [Blastocatellia bacterium]